MKKGGGKQKGAGFERLVCKALSLWVSRGKRDDVFWRSAMSGGRATIGRRQGKDRGAQAGDISAIHRVGLPFLDRFHVECKFYKALGVQNFLMATDIGNLAKFWSALLVTIQSARSVVEQRRIPMLIAKENGFPALMLTTVKGRASLENEWGVRLQPKCIVLGPQTDAYVYWFDEVFTTDEWKRPSKRPAPDRSGDGRVSVGPVRSPRPILLKALVPKRPVDSR
jgi:hypothetical protein